MEEDESEVLQKLPLLLDDLHADTNDDFFFFSSFFTTGSFVGFSRCAAAAATITENRSDSGHLVQRGKKKKNTLVFLL